MTRQPDSDKNLLDQVRPAGWTNPAPRDCYNLVVIGAGTAGLVAAAGAASLGAHVALVERDKLGGDCLNTGCVPSKTLLAEADRVDQSAQSANDFPEVMERVRAVRARLAEHDSVARFSEMGVDVFLGAARFSSRRCVEVEGAALRFSKALIATGARPALPPVDGLREAGYLTSESVFELRELPGRLAILGAGPIGCELGQAFRRLGAEVTVFDMKDRILVKEDEDVSALLRECLETEGVRFELGCAVESVQAETGEKTLRAKGRHFVFDEVLVAAGRAPNVQGLALEAAGVSYDDRHGVRVNDRLQTSNRRIFAAGDVCLALKFTHAANAAARIALTNALFYGRRKFSSRHIPWCTYTRPAVSHVGMNLALCREARMAVQVIDKSFSEVDRAVTDGDDRGFLRVILRKGGDQIVGATVVGQGAGEVIAPIVTAMQAGRGLASFSDTVFPYPTRAEIVKLAADVYNRSRLTPFRRRMLGTWMRWLR